MSCPIGRSECPGAKSCKFYEAPDTCWYPVETKIVIAQREAQAAKEAQI